MKLPIPTDNIYKFYALFGLTLLITSMFSSIYFNEKTNDLVYKYAIELDSIEKTRTQQNFEVFEKLLNKKITVAVSNRKTANYILGVTCGIGIWLALYGFGKWHKEIQPLHDELLKLQVAKLKKDANNE